MGTETQSILERALALPAIERAEVVGKLLESLDRPDSAVDLLWADEAEARVAAHKEGRMSSVSEEEAFAESDG